MNRAWEYIGRIAFWLSWPALWVYLRIGRRTRVLIVAEGKVLVVKGWLGAGDWLLPGGGLHKGEDSKLGAVREVREETGVALKPAQLTHLFAATTQRHGLRYRYDCYVVELPRIVTPKKQTGEIINCTWLDTQQLLSADQNDEINLALQAWLKG